MKQAPRLVLLALPLVLAVARLRSAGAAARRRQRAAARGGAGRPSRSSRRWSPACAGKELPETEIPVTDIPRKFDSQ